MPPQRSGTQVLDRLILERIQCALGDRAGVRISDEQLNEALTNMARQNGASLEQFARRRGRRRLLRSGGASRCAGNDPLARAAGQRAQPRYR